MEVEQFEQDHVEKHQPAVLYGLADQWKAYHDWKPLTFQACSSVKQHWDTVVDVASKPVDQVYFSGDEHGRENVELKFGQVLELYNAIYSGHDHWAKKLLTEMKLYLCQCPIMSYEPSGTSKLPQLMEDLSVYAHMVVPFFCAL